MRSPLFLVPMLVVGLVSGCSDNNNSTSPSADQGRLVIYLTDAPADYDQVNIVVDRVEVHRAGSDTSAGWFVVNGTPATYDLLQLRNGASKVLGDTSLPPGEYTQIRLILGDGCNLVVDGMTHDLRVPSGQQTGIKLNTPFTIKEGALYEIVLDFDASRSIHQTGNGKYMMSPVIRCHAVVVSGTISGVALPLEAQPLVSTKVNGDSVSTLVDPATGGFTFLAMPEGTYNLLFQSIAGTHKDTTITGVQVFRQQVTDIDTVVMTLKP